MVKKVVWLFCFYFFLSSIALQAQSKFKAGFDMGYTYSNLNANLSNLVESKYSGSYGFGASLTGEYAIRKPVFLKTAVSFLQKNYTFRRTGSRLGWYTKYYNDFLSIPFLVGVTVFSSADKSQGVWLKIAGGTYIEYLMRLQRKGQYIALTENRYKKVSETYDFKKNENMLNRLGYGLQGQLSLGYSFKKWTFYGTGNYQYGLSDISMANTNKNMQKTIQSYRIAAGTSYQFN
ncbi:outer membrane beta-barrel protein [Flavobacterium sp.]|uniref:outer membrane beta-barrel protein n=1 Tax=Flavobacterium sp. TaxID=239 RepID=UPI0026035A0E|nr:outer membrane beta-barrel protein [Flavobacterium sp.]